MWIVFAIFIVAGITFPRVFTYVFATPLMGFVSGAAIWSIFGLLGYIPGTLNAYIYCTIASTIVWGAMFFIDRQ